MHRKHELSQIRPTLHSSSTFTCLLNRGEKNSNKDTNDCNNNKKFDKGEARAFREQHAVLEYTESRSRMLIFHSEEQRKMVFGQSKKTF
jgi:hypothetical protein|tara:strand:- start:1773 stop:2039 length:267 start_codon:yes stop_codon:yes gene_type:complete